MKSILCYIPGDINNQDINYICADHKIHIRFRDYSAAGVIAGFEHKLTYLLTYLMNYAYLQQIICPADNKTLMRDFLTCRDVSEINETIRRVTCDDKYKGIRLRENYKRRIDDTYRPFGKLDIGCFPINEENGVVHLGSLNFFLRAFKITLEDYLFDDNYIIILSELSTEGINKKFINKMNRKAENQNRNSLDFVELW